MPLAVGVVDLDDDHRERPGLIPAEIEAGRVEDVAEHPQVGHEGDPPSGRVTPLLPQVITDGRVDVRRGRQQVVPVAECHDIGSIAADQQDARRDLLQLREVEREVVDVVLELVREGPVAMVTDLPLQEMRPHAARSIAGRDRSAATS